MNDTNMPTKEFVNFEYKEKIVESAYLIIFVLQKIKLKIKISELQKIKIHMM
jgi:hypothetical protein